jgi:hypothetical protein
VPRVTLNEELFACAVTGKPGPIGGAEFLNALAASILVELALGGRIEIADDGAVSVVDATPTGDAIADEVLADLPDALDANEQAGRGRRLAAVAPGLVKTAYGRTYDRVAADGIVEIRKEKKFGLISQEILKLTATGEEIRARAAGVLTGQAEPTGRDAALISLLAVAKLVDRQVPKAARAQARERAQAIAAQDQAATEVGVAIRSVKASAAALIAR